LVEEERLEYRQRLLPELLDRLGGVGGRPVLGTVGGFVAALAALTFAGDAGDALSVLLTGLLFVAGAMVLERIESRGLAVDV